MSRRLKQKTGHPGSRRPHRLLPTARTKARQRRRTVATSLFFFLLFGCLGLGCQRNHCHVPSLREQQRETRSGTSRAHCFGAELQPSHDPLPWLLPRGDVAKGRCHKRGLFDREGREHKQRRIQPDSRVVCFERLTRGARRSLCAPVACWPGTTTLLSRYACLQGWGGGGATAEGGAAPCLSTNFCQSTPS